VELLRAVNVQEQEVALEDSQVLNRSSRFNLSNLNIIEEEEASMGFGSYSQRGEPIMVEQLHYDEIGMGR